MRRAIVLLVACLGCAREQDVLGLYNSCGGGAKNVVEYHATADDMTNDKDAFQHAIDDAGTGGSVCVPKGTYLIDAGDRDGATGLILPGNFTLLMSSGTTLKALPSHGSHSLLRIGSEVLKIENVLIRGGTIEESDTPPDVPNGQVAEGIGIDIRGAGNVTLENVVVRGFSTDGIRIDGQTVGGIRQSSTAVTLANCTSEANQRHGLAILGCVDPVIQGGRFTNNSGNPSSAGIFLAPRSDLQVDGARIEAGTLLADNRYGLVAQVDPTMRPERLGSITVMGTEARGNSTAGFLVSGARGPVTLIGNPVLSNPGVGIDILLTSSALISGNPIFDSGEAGIRLACSRDNIVSGNHVNGSGKRGAAGTFAQILVETPASCAQDNGEWQQQRFSRRNLIEGNQVRLGAQRNARYGIRIDSLQCVENRVITNDLFDSGLLDALSDDGKDTVKSDNTM